MGQFSIVENKPALLIDATVDNKSTKLLVVSDLHIGSTYWSHHDDIKFDWNRISAEIEAELRDIVISNKVDSIILLGDIKNNIYKVEKDDWNLIPIFLHSMSTLCQVFLIPGNHDSKIGWVTPESIHLMGVKGMVVDDILLTHGHTLPSKLRSNINKIIMGHLHLTFLREDSVMNGQKIWIFLKVKKEVIFPSAKGSLEVVMLPSFNKYAYSNYRVRNRKINSPIMRKILKKESIEKCLIVSIDGTILGNENLLYDLLNFPL